MRPSPDGSLICNVGYVGSGRVFRASANSPYDGEALAASRRLALSDSWAEFLSRCKLHLSGRSCEAPTVDFLILPIEGSTPSSRELQSLRLDAGDQCLFVATNIADAVPAV